MPFFPNGAAGASQAAAAALAGGRKSMLITGGSGLATIPEDVGLVFCFGVSAPTTITLTPPGDGRVIEIYSFDAPGPQLTVATPTGTIVGASSYALPQMLLGAGLAQRWDVAGITNGGAPAWTVETVPQYQLVQVLQGSIQAYRQRRTLVTSEALQISDHVLLMNLSGPEAFDLPPANQWLNDELIVRDVAGNFSTATCTLLGVGGALINGSASPLTLVVSGATTRLVTDGTDWWTVGLSVL